MTNELSTKIDLPSQMVGLTTSPTLDYSVITTLQKLTSGVISQTYASSAKKTVYTVASSYTERFFTFSSFSHMTISKVQITRKEIAEQILYTSSLYLLQTETSSLSPISVNTVNFTTLNNIETRILSEINTSKMNITNITFSSTFKYLKSIFTTTSFYYSTKSKMDTTEKQSTINSKYIVIRNQDVRQLVVKHVDTYNKKIKISIRMKIFFLIRLIYDVVTSFHNM